MDSPFLWLKKLGPPTGDGTRPVRTQREVGWLAIYNPIITGEDTTDDIIAIIRWQTIGKRNGVCATKLWVRQTLSSSPVFVWRGEPLAVIELVFTFEDETFLFAVELLHFLVFESVLYLYNGAFLKETDVKIMHEHAVWENFFVRCSDTIQL